MWPAAFTLALIFASPAGALTLEYCESAAKLKAKVNYCDENPLYVAPAKTCRDSFRKKVKAKSKEAETLYAKIFKARKGDAQSEDLTTSLKVLASTEVSLTELIVQGTAILAELDGYMHDFVLPIYEGYEEDYKLNPRDASTQKIFREKECYGEPSEDIEAVKKDVAKIVKELEATKAKAVSLHQLTDASEGSLDSIGASGGKKLGGQVGKGAGEIKGQHDNKKSSISGVEESKKKNKKLPE